MARPPLSIEVANYIRANATAPVEARKVAQRLGLSPTTGDNVWYGYRHFGLWEREGDLMKHSTLYKQREAEERLGIIQRVRRTGSVSRVMRVVQCSHEGCEHECELHVPAQLAPENVAQRFEIKGWALGKEPKCPLHVKDAAPALPEVAVGADRKAEEGHMDEKDAPYLGGRQTALSELPTGSDFVGESGEKVHHELHDTGFAIPSLLDDQPQSVAGIWGEPSPNAVIAIVQAVRILEDRFAHGRYEQGWSDERVAKEVGLSDAAIRTIRLADPSAFGEILPDPEVVALESEVAAVASMLADLQKRLASLKR